MFQLRLADIQVVNYWILARSNAGEEGTRIFYLEMVV